MRECFNAGTHGSRLKEYPHESDILFKLLSGSAAVVQNMTLIMLNKFGSMIELFVSLK